MEPIIFIDPTGMIQVSTRAGRRNRLETLEDQESTMQSLPPGSQEKTIILADFHQRYYELQRENVQVNEHLEDVVQNQAVIIERLRQDLRRQDDNHTLIRRRLDFAYQGLQRLRGVFVWFLCILHMALRFLEIQNQRERQAREALARQVADLQENVDRERQAREALARQVADLQENVDREKEQKLQAQHEIAALKEKCEKEKQQAEQEKAAHEKERREKERLQKQVDDLMKKLSHSKTVGSNNNDDHCSGGCGPSNKLRS